MSQATTIQLYSFCGFLCVLLWLICTTFYGCAAPRWGSVLGCWASRFLWLEVAVLRVFCSAVLCSPTRQASGALFSATFQQLCYCGWLVRVFDLWNACCNLSHTGGGKCGRSSWQRWRYTACACLFITFSLRTNVCAMFSYMSAQWGLRTPKKVQGVCLICPALIFFVNEVSRASNN